MLELGASAGSRYRCGVTSSIFKALADAASNGESVALGIITGVKGSSPQKLGAKALFYPDRKIKGTLGGGCLEADVLERAQKLLETGESEILIYDTTSAASDSMVRPRGWPVP